MVSRCDVYKAASEKKPVSLQIFCNFYRENEGSTPIDERGNTVLHILSVHGNTVAIRELDKQGLLSTEHLKKCNVNGEIALHEAARFGRKEIAEIMLKKEGDGGDLNLILARNELGETPIHLAAAFGREDVFNFLKTKINDDQLRLRTGDGRTVLHAAVNGEFYNLAMSILESYPNLADKRQENGMTALNLLASKTFSFRSMWFATMDFVPWHTMKILAYHCIVPNEFDYETAGDVENPRDFNISKLKGALISKLISACDWIKEIDDTKQKHVVARKLAKKLIEKEKNWIDYPNCENIAQQKKNRVIDPLIQATKQCIIEIVEEILENFPHAANTVDDENGHNILHIAAEQKNLVLYDYLQKTVNHADRMMLDIDYHGNTVLHIAASQHYQGLAVFGPAKSMTWEVFWFKVHSHQH